MKYFPYLFLLLFAVPAYAGSVGYQAVGSYVDWTPDCSKPSEPTFFISDRASFNIAVDEFNSYIWEAESYIECIKREAESDARNLHNAVEDGARNAISNISDEVDFVRSTLERQRGIIN